MNHQGLIVAPHPDREFCGAMERDVNLGSGASIARGDHDLLNNVGWRRPVRFVILPFVDGNGIEDIEIY